MSEDGKPRRNPEVVRAIEEMADHIARRPFSRDLVHRLEWLVEILIDRGYLEPEHRALIRKDKGDRPVVRLSLYGDKRQVTNSDPGCAERMHLCKARCCAIEVEMSAEDVEEGVLKWSLERPYLLRKADHGLCEHVQGDGRCGAYEHRPAQCRAYDCIGDARIWIDYEAKIPAPMPWWIIPLEDWTLPPAEQKARVAARFDAAPPADGEE
jgi:Fe-S-cluster containining protein